MYPRGATRPKHARRRGQTKVQPRLIRVQPAGPSMRPLLVVHDESCLARVAEDILDSNLELLPATESAIVEPSLPDRPPVAGFPCRSGRDRLPVANPPNDIDTPCPRDDVRVIGHKDSSVQRNFFAIALGRESRPDCISDGPRQNSNFRMCPYDQVEGGVRVGVRLGGQADRFCVTHQGGVYGRQARGETTGADRCSRDSLGAWRRAGTKARHYAERRWGGGCRCGKTESLSRDC